MGRIVRLLVVICLVVGSGCGCRAVFAPDKAQNYFEGRMLVAVTPQQAERISRSQQTRSSSSPDEGWRFERVPALRSSAGQRQRAPREWLVAAPPRMADRKKIRSNPWDVAHQVVDGEGRGVYRSFFGDLSRTAGEPISAALLEPDYYVKQRRRPATRARREQNADYDPTVVGADKVTTCDRPSSHWPRMDSLDWYMSDDYSQLKSAREEVRRRRGPVRSPQVVKLAVIDTGYNEGHISTPPGLNEAASRDFSENPLRPKVGAADPYHRGKFNQPGHGTAVLGLLAGDRIRAERYGFADYLGAIPDYEIVMYRVSDSVIHFFPSTLALAIKYAVANDIDVISLSHGGLPSRMLADAVNEAYENGTAIFAAAGDFIEVPLLGYTSPRSIVYPAAFSRVVSVCGATAQKRSYSRSPGLLSLLLHWDPGNWMLRGSYGPDTLMHEAIGAYTPNVMWARYTRKHPANLLDLDGAGTSAAVPQVAAAAALWLELHRDDALLRDTWRSWEKVEAVYLALFDSAEKNTPEGGDAFSYFGNGLLKAGDALDLGVPKYMEKRPPAKVGFSWLRLWAGLLPGVRSASAAADAERQQLHASMIVTEVAQLVYHSPRLQKLVRESRLKSMADAPPDNALLLPFLRAVAEEKNASGYLRRTLLNAMAQQERIAGTAER